MEEDKFVALSGYCKQAGLSVPKDFDLTALVLTVKEENPGAVQISGYKFKTSVLDVYVPQMKFKETTKRPTEPDSLFAYGTTLDEKEVYVIAAIKPSAEKKFKREIEDILEQAIDKIDIVEYTDNPQKLIESLNTISTLLDGQAFAENVDLGKLNGKFYINTVDDFEYQVMNRLLGK